MPEVRNHVVSQAEAGQKLLRFLERQVGGDVPRSALMRWIRTGQVRLDGRRAKPFDRVSAGQVVRIPPFAASGPGPTPAQAERPDEGASAGKPSAPAQPGGGLVIVHRDETLLVIAKPAGLPTQPGSGWTDSVATRLAAYAQDGLTPAPVHRLDRDTSGLLLAARTFSELRRLSELIARHGLAKTYLAWVEGELQGKQPLMLRDRLEKAGEAGAEKVRAGRGKEALAAALPLLVRSGATLLAIRLVTGRTHQLRVQLASRGHPILGDRKYGASRPAPGLLLHAWRLVLDERVFELLPDWPAPWAVRREDAAGADALLDAAAGEAAK